MSTQMSEEELYRIAKKRVEEKKGFRTHLAVYIGVNIFLIIIWAVTGRGSPPWFIFPLGGWGIGILFHFLGVYVFSRQTERDKKEIEKEVDRLRKSGM